MRLIVALLSVLLTSCATFKVADNLRPGSPRFFGGSRLDNAAITNNQAELERFKAYNIVPPTYPAADFVPSFLADVAFLPTLVTYTFILEPLFGRGR